MFKTFNNKKLVLVLKIFAYEFGARKKILKIIFD